MEKLNVLWICIMQSLLENCSQVLLGAMFFAILFTYFYFGSKDRKTRAKEVDYKHQEEMARIRKNAPQTQKKEKADL